MHSSTAAGKLITRVFRQNMYVKKAIRSAYNCGIYMSYLATCNRMNLVCTKIYKKYTTVVALLHQTLFHFFSCNDNVKNNLSQSPNNVIY